VLYPLLIRQSDIRNTLSDTREVVQLAHNMSFIPNTTDYIQRYGTKAHTNESKGVEGAKTKNTCISWRQTAACRPNGRRESRKDRACDKIVPKGASGYCACGGGRRAQAVGCFHHPFRCDEECRQDDPPSKAYDKPTDMTKTTDAEVDTKAADTNAADTKAADGAAAGRR
jgi:hypothetical protein